MNSNIMDDQYRRGINRPNANRLTLSLGPLVAQRSLLFRVQSDLVQKATYGELTPAEESAFFAMTPSARILSSAIVGKTPMSSASVYSQDSWRPPVSGILKTPFITAPDDMRRRAMMFSPSVQWPDLNSSKLAAPASAAQSATEHVMPYIGSPIPQCVPDNFTAFSPIQSGVFNIPSIVNTGIVIPSIEVTSSVDNIASPSVGICSAEVEFSALPDVLLTTAPLQGWQPNNLQDPTSIDGGKKLKKNKPVEDTSKRMSKHSKAFGRVMAHLSLQPSKKEIDQRRKTLMPTMPIISNPTPLIPRTEDIRLSSQASEASVGITTQEALHQTPLTMALALPSVRFSPIRTSFIANASSSSDSVKPFSFLSEPMVASMSEAGARARAARLSLNPVKRRTMPPPALNLLPIMHPVIVQPPASVQGHRRYKSSPAVMNFSWMKDDQDIPPVPKLPSMLLGSTLKVPL